MQAALSFLWTESPVGWEIICEYFEISFAVVRKDEIIPQIASNKVLGNKSDPKQIGDLIPKPNAEPGFRSEGTPKPSCCSLFTINQWSKRPVKLAKRSTVVIAGAMQLACKHVRFGHSQSATFTGQKGDACCCVAYERDTAT